MPVWIEVSSIDFFALCHLLFALFAVEAYLKDSLERFISELPVKVHLLRNTDRLGLMKSRLKGNTSDACC